MELKRINQRSRTIRLARKLRKSFALVIMAAIVVVALPACREKGPAEKAGENLDKAVNDAKDKAKEAADKLKK